MNAFKDTLFAGGDGDYSVLSHLASAHSIGEGFLGFLTMRESNALRGVNVKFCEAVMEYPWMNAETRNRGSVRAWRAAFPAARAVNVSRKSMMNLEGRRTSIVDSDFVHIRGNARAWLHTVNMAGCSRVTDAAFGHLRGIHTLIMYYCRQATITGVAFVHLRGILSLNIMGCKQATITDAAFGHLRGIKSLNMRYCNQPTITDAAFVHLRGIHTLNMHYCNQPTITDAAFEHLSGIQSLDMAYCYPATITGATFAHLHGIRNLNTYGCNPATQDAVDSLP